MYLLYLRHVSFMYLLCISAVYLHNIIISHIQDNGATHINTHRGTCVCHGGASPRRQQPQRDPEGLVAGTAPATSDRQSHTDNAHHSAHTCAPGTSSHMRTSGICTALSSAHARQTQRMQSSHSCGDSGTVICGAVRCGGGAVKCGVVRCSAVRCSEVWLGVVGCGVCGEDGR